MRTDVKASKKLAHDLSTIFKAKTIPDKKKYNKKKERRHKKIKFWDEY